MNTMCYETIIGDYYITNSKHAYATSVNNDSYKNPGIRLRADDLDELIGHIEKDGDFSVLKGSSGNDFYDHWKYALRGKDKMWKLVSLQIDSSSIVFNFVSKTLRKKRNKQEHHGDESSQQAYEYIIWHHQEQCPPVLLADVRIPGKFLPRTNRISIWGDNAVVTEPGGRSIWFKKTDEYGNSTVVINETR